MLVIKAKLQPQFEARTIKFRMTKNRPVQL